MLTTICFFRELTITKKAQRHPYKVPFKYKVQHLINAGWLSFQEDGPNVKTNPLASHGGASVNAIEKDRPSGSKRLEDVAASRRFIYQSLQAACMVSRG